MEVRYETEEIPPKPAAPVYDALAEFVGAFEGLPADLARNHDHYLHGTPKP